MNLKHILQKIFIRKTRMFHKKYPPMTLQPTRYHKGMMVYSLGTPVTVRDRREARQIHTQEKGIR